MFFDKRLELIRKYCSQYKYLDELEEDGSRMLLTNVTLSNFYANQLNEQFKRDNDVANMELLEQVHNDNSKMLMMVVLFNDYQNPYLSDESELKITKVELSVFNNAPQQNLSDIVGDTTNDSPIMITTHMF